jgi:ribosomal protein S18 acetylase RimI-like enzyme
MIRRSDPLRRDPEWICQTAAEVYRDLGDYGKIIPAWMNHPGVLTFVEVDDSTPVEVRRGFILIGFYEPEDLIPTRLVADLLAIAVAPGHQRRGLGRMLLELAVDVARLAYREPPVREIRLTVAETNAPALALFKGAVLRRPRPQARRLRRRPARPAHAPDPPRLGYDCARAWRSAMRRTMYGKPTWTVFIFGASWAQRPKMMTTARST